MRKYIHLGLSTLYKESKARAVTALLTGEASSKVPRGGKALKSPERRSIFQKIMLCLLNWDEFGSNVRVFRYLRHRCSEVEITHLPHRPRMSLKPYERLVWRLRRAL